MVELEDRDVLTDLSVLETEPAEEYHARAGEYLSSHLLADFRKCPQLYRQKLDGLVEEKDKASFLEGRATHALVLEGRERFDAEYVRIPVNSKTGKPIDGRTKAFKTWATAESRTVLPHDMASRIERIAAAVRSHDEAQKLLSAGRAAGVLRTEYCGQPCQIRIDWLNPALGIVDLKTCNDVAWFAADGRTYGYAHQLAFYRAVLAQALGQKRGPVHVIGIEKKAPYRVTVGPLDEEALALAQRENEASMRRLKDCQERQVWPTDYEEKRVFRFI